MSDMLPIFNTLEKEKQDILIKHLELVMDANDRVNLTRITNMDEGMLLHVEDSLSALEEIERAPIGEMADLGSGAGFPGIPLAIASGRKTTLVDARKKKMDEVSSIIEKLGQDSLIDTFAGRAELLARKNGQRYSLITARALSQISVLLELASPLLIQGGHLVCYKAKVEDAELEHADEVGRLTGMQLLSDRSFVLGEEYTRRVLVYVKSGKQKNALPRLEGQAQKNPL